MNDMLVPTDERKVPTEWPRRLYLPPPQYFHTSHRRDAVEVRAQALERYRKTPPRGLQPCAVGSCEPEHVGLLVDCAQMCQVNIDYMLRGSLLHGRVCGVCAEACKLCAKNCAQLAEEDQMLKQCAELCRRCAESWRPDRISY